MVYDDQKLRKILIVDDERAIRQNMFEILTYSLDKRRNSQRLTELEKKIFNREDDILETKPKFDVTLAHQGEQAIDIIEKSVENNDKFSVVFMDFIMPPGISGEKAAEEIRKIDPDIYIVFITGYANVEPEEISKNVPPQSKLFYIEKPIHRKELIQMATSLSDKWFSDVATEELLNTLKDEINDLEKARPPY